VHKARLHDGTEVAVKVQYAGLQTTVAADLGTFAALSAAAAWLLPDYQVLSLQVSGVRHQVSNCRHEITLRIRCRSACCKR